jgi:hypothetical protein
LRFPASGDRHLVVFAVALSLGLTHHPSLAFPAGVFVLYLILVDSSLLRQPRRWIRPAGAFLLAGAVLVYLPLRGAPHLATLSGFLDHVLARGFRGDMFALSLLGRSMLLPTLLRFQFNLALLLGVLLGGVLLLWRDRRLALLLVGSFLVHTAATLTYDAPQTLEYEMPGYVSLALLVAIPFGEISRLRSRGEGCKRLSSIILRSTLAVVVTGTIVNLVARLPSYDRLSQSHDARRYAEALLRDVPEDAVILSNWHWFNPIRYLQRIEGLRPDVIVKYVAPSGEPLARTWVDHIEAYVSQRPVVVTRYFEHQYGELLCRFDPLGEAFVVRREPGIDQPSPMTPLDVTLGGQVRFVGYRLEALTAEPARPLTMSLAWSPTALPTADIALFAQLIGPEGRLWSAAVDPRHSSARLTIGETVVDRFVVYPLLHAPPGDYRLVVGAYSSAGRLTASDGSAALELRTVHLRASRTRPVTRHPYIARFSGGLALIGVDYDVSDSGEVRTYLHWAGPGPESPLLLSGANDTILTQGSVPALKRGEYATLAFDRPSPATGLTVLGENGPRRWNLVFRGSAPLPLPDSGEHYVPFGDALVLTGHSAPRGDLARGAEVRLDLRFLGQRPLERDYVVSTALTGLNPDGTWAWRDSDDTVPALGAIPTLKWIHGSSVVDPHRMTVPVDAPSVPVTASLVVYDHFTQRPLPSLDERLDGAVSLRTWKVSSQ